MKLGLHAYIVGISSYVWKMESWARNWTVKLSFPWGQMAKMSSIYLSQIKGFN